MLKVKLNENILFITSCQLIYYNCFMKQRNDLQTTLYEYDMDNF